MSAPSRLFETLQLGPLTVPNRLLRSATWEGMASDAGEVTDALVALYGELARGGVGLIVTGFAYVTPAGQALPGQLGIHDDAMIPGLSRIAEAVHAEGGRVAVQIVHAGAQTRPEWNGGAQPVAPSEVRRRRPERSARALEAAEIEALVAAFAEAARRGRAAGFDAVQLHLAHGYLLSQFLSPHRNQRRDAYGGDPERRRRVVLDTYAAVRDAVGPSYPVLAKLNAVDCVEGGLEVEEAGEVAVALAEAGLDGLEVSGGIPDAGGLGAVRAGIRTPEDEGYFQPEAAAIKARVPRLPVHVVGGLRSPQRMEAILARGDADGVALCRPLIREPDLPRRWAAGDRAPSACESCRRCLKAGLSGGITCVQKNKAPARGASEPHS